MGFIVEKSSSSNEKNVVVSSETDGNVVANFCWSKAATVGASVGLAVVVVLGMLVVVAIGLGSKTKGTRS